MEDRILTLHPEGKKGLRISRQKYDAVREAIFDILRTQGGMTFTALSEAVEQRLAEVFDGSEKWYFMCVKLDLEARGAIQCVHASGAQRISLAE